MDGDRLPRSAARRRGVLRRLPARLLPALLLTCTVGCVGFQRDWHDTRCYHRTCAQGLEGQWTGTWCSHHNGHHGKLKAIITHLGNGCYRAQFHATYAVLIPYAFEVQLQATETEGGYAFSGDADLGKLAGGVYQYQGSASACDFQANFCATGGDFGEFTLTRVTDCR